MDRYFQNGIIYTVDDNDAIAEAIAIKDGRIVFVGSNKDGKKYKDVADEIINLEGKMMLPGFIDTHIHIFSEQMSDFYLSGISNVDVIEKM